VRGLRFPHAAQGFRVERTREFVRTGKTTHEVQYGVLSLPPDQADEKRVMHLLRGQWTIENTVHYVRDFSYDEDRSTVRTGAGPQVMATLRNLAIALIYHYLPGGVPHGQRLLRADQRRLLKLIGA
jgi:hypothetical protein